MEGDVHWKLQYGVGMDEQIVHFPVILECFEQLAIPNIKQIYLCLGLGWMF